MLICDEGLKAPQRSVKRKIYVNFLSLSGIGTGRFKFLIIKSVNTQM